MSRTVGEFVVWMPRRPATAEWARTAASLPWPLELPVHADASDAGALMAWTGAVHRNDRPGEILLHVGPGDPAATHSGEKPRQQARLGPDGRIVATTDHLRLGPLYYGHGSWGWGVATDLRLLAALPEVPTEISQESLFHLLNFACIPTPHSIYAGIRKLAPGSSVVLDRSGARPARYWAPVYPEDLDGPEAELIQQTRNCIEREIAGLASTEVPLATFLSGGTDSSAITGMIALRRPGRPPSAFSIGFDIEGFDELVYARSAAEAFGVRHVCRTLGPKDVLECVPRLLDSFDEPFANSSAVASYYCAQLAVEEGFTTMVAGDGGDEIFGGNERYAKDYWFTRYHELPSALRLAGRSVERLLRPIDQRLVNRVKNFVRRGEMENPERFYSDDAFASVFYADMLAPGLRATVPPEASLDILREHYAAVDAKSELNRLLYMDLQVAIADNDLIKVNRAARASGVSVLYPYLAPSLVEHMGRIPARLKVNGTRKRYLYKRAVADVVPEAIRNKKKQGMGMPLGLWFRNDPALREWVSDTVLSQSALGRGYFEPAFMRRLVDRHMKGVWDYRQELWTLAILELWHLRCHERRRGSTEAGVVAPRSGGREQVATCAES